MTLREIFANVIQTLLIELDDSSPTFIRTRVVSDINAALQLMATGENYFTAEAITLNIGLATPSAALPEDTLNVSGPILLGDGVPLARIATRGEFDSFSQIYLNTKNAHAPARPVGVYISEGLRAGADNTVEAVASFVPAPDADYTVSLYISRRPHTYTVADLSGTSPVVPLPHKMAESILLPLVRWNVRTSHFFTSKDMLPSLEADYNAALTQLGLAAPASERATSAALDRKRTAARIAARDAYHSTR